MEGSRSPAPRVRPLILSRIVAAMESVRLVGLFVVSPGNRMAFVIDTVRQNCTGLFLSPPAVPG